MKHGIVLLLHGLGGWVAEDGGGGRVLRGAHAAARAGAGAGLTSARRAPASAYLAVTNRKKSRQVSSNTSQDSPAARSASGSPAFPAAAAPPRRPLQPRRPGLPAATCW